MIHVRCVDCNKVLATRLAKLGAHARGLIQKSLVLAARRGGKHLKESQVVVDEADVLKHPLVDRALSAWAQRTRRVYTCPCGTATRLEPDASHPHKARPVKSERPAKNHP